MEKHKIQLLFKYKYLEKQYVNKFLRKKNI